MTEPKQRADRAATRDDELRQAARDREYLAACRAHGIEPEPPDYDSPRLGVDADALDNIAHGTGSTWNGHRLITRREVEPLKKLSAAQESVLTLLDVLLLTPARGEDVARMVQTFGRRCICLLWLLGRLDLPLAEVARQLGVTRAALSAYVIKIGDKTGVHGRGQKGTTTRPTYADSARRSWKLRRLNTALRSATT